MSKPLAKGLEKYIGKWVAVTNKTIVASSESIEEVAKAAEARHIRKPMIFKVPRLKKGHSFF